MIIPKKLSVTYRIQKVISFDEICSEAECTIDNIVSYYVEDDILHLRLKNKIIKTVYLDTLCAAYDEVLVPTALVELDEKSESLEYCNDCKVDTYYGSNYHPGRIYTSEGYKCQSCAASSIAVMKQPLMLTEVPRDTI